MANEERQGRIVRSISGFYDVALPEGILTCQGRGILRKEGMSPLTGDLVTVTETKGKGMIQKVLPRKNGFVRPAVANVDALVIFAANVNPVTEPFLIDRVAAIAGNKGVETILCVNKTDLDEAADLCRIYRHAGFRVIPTSAQTGFGVEELRKALQESLPPLRETPVWAKAAFSMPLCPGWAWPPARFPKNWAGGGTPPAMWSSLPWTPRPLLWIPQVFPPLIRTRWM